MVTIEEFGNAVITAEINKEILRKLNPPNIDEICKKIDDKIDLMEKEIAYSYSK